MATRLNRKNAGVPTNKEIVQADKPTSKTDLGTEPPGAQLKTTPIAKRLMRKTPTAAKKIVKKSTLAIRMKAKKKPVKLNAKTLENRKKLIKNGIKEAKTRKRKAVLKKEKDDTPPVLEPIFPIEENTETKKQTKRRLTKKTVKKNVELPDEKKIKIETDDTLSVSSDITDISDIPALPKQVRKPRAAKKIKIEPETLEDVMNDLNFLIKADQDVKKEPDSMSESGRSDSATPKPRKLTKKQRIEQLKTKIMKENVENTLDASQEKVIDMLDLNVRKIKKKPNVTKRRHSIEKFPVGSADNVDVTLPQLSPFNCLPRSFSPRPKRSTKQRPSVDGIARRSSPYTTRSDSPARILRNGKQRKLKDLALLDGLDPETRKRRRLCSDLSGSELSVSKFSGYESDSSFSDLASLHGGEIMETSGSETNKVETESKLVDTNSNLCNSVESAEIVADSSSFPVNASAKVPEKDLILDIMKQTFNDENCSRSGNKSVEKNDSEAGTVVVEKFYGRDERKAEEEPTTVEDVEKIVVPEPEAMQTDYVPSETIHKETADRPVEIVEDLHEFEPAEEVSQPVQEIAEATFEDGRFDGLEPCLGPVKPPVDVEGEEDDEKEEEVVGPVIEEVNGMYEELGEDLSQRRGSQEGGKSEEVEEAAKEVPVAVVEESDSNKCSGEETESSSCPVSESAEELAAKESILKALGLQSLRAAEEAKKTKDKPAPKGDSYTGTLKTVIKINRDKKKGRSSFKMAPQKSKTKAVASTSAEQPEVEENYEIMKEGTSSTWKQSSQSSDTAGAHRKSHYSNRSNMDGSSEHTSDGEAQAQDGSIKALVIPEKASSFSIHPGRLCKDECSYCFGKFGLFDTPCHIAQMKSVERQNKILASEKHLTRDSCLCDACYRHVDRKSNTPSYTNKSLKRNSLVAPGPRQNHCHVLGCNKVSANILRRKWIIKMRKSICQVINIDLDNPGLHSIPICDEHYSALEHLMICAMCKRRLARNHIHYLGSEVTDLNNALRDEGIPLTLTDKPVVCKLCKCFASIILKDPEERPDNNTYFFREYKRRLLHFNDIVPMDEAAAEEPIAVPSKTDKADQVKKKSKKVGKNSSTNDSTSQNDADGGESQENFQERVPSTGTNSQPQSRSESPSDDYNGVDYNTLIPAIAMDCGSDTESKKETARKPPVVVKRIPRIESIKDAVEISKILKISNDKCRSSDVVVQKLGANPSISVRQLFPGEEDLPLTAHVDFANVKDRTPEGWEKCASVIQYDGETKRLWQELQKPYGNQSSFMRHLILLEKYFRNGDLVLAPNASHHSVNYSESVHNRLKAYDNIPSKAGNIQPISMIPFNKMQRSSSGIITSANPSLGLNTATATHGSSNLNGNPAVSVTSVPTSAARSTPLTLSQLNSPPLIPASAVLQPVRSKMVGAPPGLISLHPGTARPVAPLVKVPQSQKIKFPITKNWRPNLIPIDPTQKQEKKGLVQVISGGKQYHITMEDYKKMCAIKRSFEIKQKRLQEAQNAKSILVTHNAVVKSITPRKGLIISKTSTVTHPAKETNASHSDNSALESENILEKLDRQVEKLESKLNEKPSSLLLPKIPKSLTVIPQTVTRKSSRPSSPALLITPKNNGGKS